MKSSKKNKNFKLVALTENRLINKKFNGIKPELNSDKAFKNRYYYWFYNAKLHPWNTQNSIKTKEKVVIGTTGFSEAKKM